MLLACADSPTASALAATIRSSGGCHPRNAFRTVTPCQVALSAEVADAAGGPYTYAWSGCALGNNQQAVCTVPDLGPRTASVLVSDRNGRSGRAEVTVEGTNQAPNFTALGCFTYPFGCPAGGCPPNTVLPNRLATCWFDGPDLDQEGDSWHCDGVHSEGACSPAGISLCGGLGDTIEVDFRAGASGTCSVVVTVVDSWGASREIAATATIAAP